ncbi:MAG: hypothetical protein ACRDGF_09070, partial [Chloroflexota bacterium]
MKIHAPVLALSVMLAVCAPAALQAQKAAPSAADFAAISHRVALALHAHAHHHRLLGASQLVIRGAGHIGSRGTHVALFDLPGEPTRSERARLNAALTAALAPPWQQVRHHTSRYGEKETWVFAQPHGANVTTVVCLLERGQATLVMANADPQAVLD